MYWKQGDILRLKDSRDVTALELGDSTSLRVSRGYSSVGLTQVVEFDSDEVVWVRCRFSSSFGGMLTR